MTAYQIRINVDDTPEQEVFMSFQCSVLSAPIVEGENILFKSQAIEFNGKIRTEIPITCVGSTRDSRIFGKINKLQKGNKIDIMGNLIQNDEEIIVLVNYIVYAGSTDNLTSTERKDLTKIPWLNSSGIKKATNENPSQKSSNDLPDIVNDNKEETNEMEDAKVIDISDNDNDNAEGIKI